MDRLLPPRSNRDTIESYADQAANQPPATDGSPGQTRPDHPEQAARPENLSPSLRHGRRRFPVVLGASGEGRLRRYRSREVPASQSSPRSATGPGPSRGRPDSPSIEPEIA